MRDEHLTPLLLACSEAELALLIEFLGRPPAGLLWRDPRIREPHPTHARRVEAVIAEVLRCGDHTITGRLGGGNGAYLQVLCDVLRELELPEDPAPGIEALELRVVRYVLDTEFDRLPQASQDELLADFFAGNFFVAGLHGYDTAHPFLTRLHPGEPRALARGKAGRALLKIGEHQLARQARSMLRKAALRVVLRSFAGAAAWAFTAWEWLGPAYRLTVPAICYFAYLRHTHAVQLRADEADTSATDTAASPATTGPQEASQGVAGAV